MLLAPEIGVAQEWLDPQPGDLPAGAAGAEEAMAGRALRAVSVPWTQLQAMAGTGMEEKLELLVDGEPLEDQDWGLLAVLPRCPLGAEGAKHCLAARSRPAGDTEGGEIRSNVWNSLQPPSLSLI